MSSRCRAERERHAAGVDGDPTPSPLLGHVGRRPAPARRVENEVAGVGSHEEAPSGLPSRWSGRRSDFVDKAPVIVSDHRFSDWLNWQTFDMQESFRVRRGCFDGTDACQVGHSLSDRVSTASWAGRIGLPSSYGDRSQRLLSPLSAARLCLQVVGTRKTEHPASGPIIPLSPMSSRRCVPSFKRM